MKKKRRKRKNRKNIAHLRALYNAPKTDYGEKIQQVKEAEVSKKEEVIENRIEERTEIVKKDLARTTLVSLALILAIILIRFLKIV